MGIRGARRHARRPIPGATRSARATPIATAAAASGTTGRPHRSARSSPMRSASTTWLATCGNGCRIAITTTTTERPPMVRRGPGGDCSRRVVRGGSWNDNPRTPPLGQPHRVHRRRSELRSRVPCREDAYPLNLYLFTSWVQGEALVEFFGGHAPMTDNSRRTGAAIEAHYQFLAWLVPTIEKFPKSHKFTIGDRIEKQARLLQIAIAENTHCFSAVRSDAIGPSRRFRSSLNNRSLSGRCGMWLDGR